MADQGEGQAIVLGLAASVAGILVGGLLDHYFFNLSFPHSVSIFWLYLGLAMAAVQLSAVTVAPETQRPERSGRSAAWGERSAVGSR
jgi:F0F1-type ATP synthase assembly protein I